MNVEAGQRVVRGPNWKWGGQDGGEGHIGTVTGSGMSPLSTAVDVVWDSGDRNRYRTGAESSYDLRLLDNATSGVKHEGIRCSVCDEQDIAGMRWKCLDKSCENINLCTPCYMTDNHDVEHHFLRIASPNSEGVQVPPRSGSAKVLSRGIFAGAKVRRGSDWKWGMADGGEGKLGTVMELIGWKSASHRSAATVKWLSSSFGCYRCGHKGKVDIKCQTPADGGKYYRDHLPVLGSQSSTKASSRSEPEKSSYKSSDNMPEPPKWTSKVSNRVDEPTTPTYKPGDKVTILVQESKLRELQEGHGGYNSRMADSIGNVGHVRRVDGDGDVVVQYGRRKWFLNSKALTKVELNVGDSVTIDNDPEMIKELQQGHGGWIESMRKIAGKTVRLIKIDASGDYTVFFNDDEFVFNPACCLPYFPEKSRGNDSDDSDKSKDGEKATDFESLLRTAFAQFVGTHNGSRLVQAAHGNNLEAVQSILAKNSENVDATQNGKTALHLACYNGNVEMVTCLLHAGADVSIRDEEDGCTPLHYAAHQNHPQVMKVLLEYNAPIDATTEKGYTALFISVHLQYPDCVSFLISHQCNINMQDQVGDTALYDAITLENRTIIVLLTGCFSAKFNMKNKKGFNPLHHAAFHGNAFATKKILERAGNLVDLKMEEGWTPLHIAAKNGFLETVQVLVEEGDAEVDAKGILNHTPLQLAHEERHQHVVDYLVQHGARMRTRGADEVQCPTS